MPSSTLDETNTFALSLSDGTPRHVLLVKEQLEDYRTVIEYVRAQPEFDAKRVILWGSSFSGTSIDQKFFMSFQRTLITICS